MILKGDAITRVMILRKWVMILAAIILTSGVAVAGLVYVYFLPPETGTYQGDVTQVSGSWQFTLSNQNDWVAIGAHYNTTNFRLASTHNVDKATVVAYLMNATQYQNFKANGNISYLLVQDPPWFGNSYTYDGSTGPGDFFAVWMNLGSDPVTISMTPTATAIP